MKNFTVLERSDVPFADRARAGKELARALGKMDPEKTVVLGIPRGGVIVAKYLALELGAPLDIILARKIGAPGNPEFAVGAIGEDGHVYLNQEYARQAGADEAYIEGEKQRQMAEIKRRAAIFRKVHPPIPLKDRTVIVTDDGVATGATFEAALWSARAEKPRKLIAAIPVGPEDTLRRLAQGSDALVCLRVPEDFYALSKFYLHFEQVDDAQVLEILRSHNPAPRKQ
jgi:predicted phosphoribosyltransferase